MSALFRISLPDGSVREVAPGTTPADIAAAIGSLSARVRCFDALDPVRQRALINLTFNIGIEAVLGFHKMLSALIQQDYETAAKELLFSRYAVQVGARATRLAHMLRTGTV